MKAKWTTPSAYARHRGVTPAAVSLAIKSGRLQKCIARRAGRPWITDVALADEEWAANTRSTDASSPAVLARARHETAKAERLEMDLAHRRGELISVEQARRDVMALFHNVRQAIRAIPHRLGQNCPHLDRPTLKRIGDLVDEALTEIADEGAEAVVERARQRAR